MLLVSPKQSVTAAFCPFLQRCQSRSLGLSTLGWSSENTQHEWQMSRWDFMCTISCFVFTDTCTFVSISVGVLFYVHFIHSETLRVCAVRRPRTCFPHLWQGLIHNVFFPQWGSAYFVLLQLVFLLWQCVLQFNISQQNALCILYPLLQLVEDFMESCPLQNKEHLQAMSR